MMHRDDFSPGSAAPSAPDGTLATVVSFDFRAKQLADVDVVSVRAEMAAGRFVWIDVNIARADEARALLASLALCEPEIIEDAFSREPATQLARYDDYLHLVLSGCRLGGKSFELERVDVVMGERFLLTLRRGDAAFIRALRKHYRTDFVRFAQSPSFMMFEIWDHLIDNYLSVHKAFEERVQAMQRALAGDVDDRVFGDVSALSSDLLDLRKVVLPARAVLTDLATKKSAFVSEATQPFLLNMVGTVERVLQDVLVDRDILSDALNSHMSLVAHRTNKVMGKLTVVSVIFLPLTFLCGVYGMNFEVLPETKWEWGYYGFWGMAIAIVIVLVAVMRRARLL
ncbi:MAG: magnesium transporter CorA family protein [Phycisphaerales bacterium]